VPEKKKKPPPDEYSAFKDLLDKIAKVPKAEIEQREREYRAERKNTDEKTRKRG
jgi:hypothetical protein